jgi:acyl carrier protein
MEVWRLDVTLIRGDLAERTKLLCLGGIFMDHGDLRDQLRTMIAELIEIEDFGDDQKLTEDLGVDSMMAIEIAARVEKRYHIRISEEELRELRTFNDIVRVTESALSTATAV